MALQRHEHLCAVEECLALTLLMSVKLCAQYHAHPKTKSHLLTGEDSTLYSFANLKIHCIITPRF